MRQILGIIAVAIMILIVAFGIKYLAPKASFATPSENPFETIESDVAVSGKTITSKNFKFTLTLLPTWKVDQIDNENRNLSIEDSTGSSISLDYMKIKDGYSNAGKEFFDWADHEPDKLLAYLKTSNADSKIIETDSIQLLHNKTFKSGLDTGLSYTYTAKMKDQYASLIFLTTIGILKPEGYYYRFTLLTISDPTNDGFVDKVIASFDTK